MYFISTDQTRQERVSFEHTLRFPIPSPGHLWIPESIPSCTFPSKENKLIEFIDCVMQVYASGIWKKEMLDHFEMPLHLVEKTFRERTMYELELFHGPTEAFKDVGCFVAAQMYKEMFDAKEYRVVVATSGDTGGAVAHAFSKTDGLPVTIFYPKKRISPYQERQIVDVDDPYRRILPVAVDGDFDRCQKIVKDILMNHPNTISSNSISLVRLLPQIAYHAWCAAQFEVPITLIVPSGNMGNACSAIMAKQMGANIKMIHIACNENDSVARYINHQDDEYTPKQTVQTLATAMDVGKPSNWIRLTHLVDLRTCDYITSSRTDTNNIRMVKEDMQCCPHTAVGYHASIFVYEKPIVVLSTASRKKFIDGSPRNPLHICQMVQPTKLHCPSYSTIWILGLDGTNNIFPQWEEGMDIKNAHGCFKIPCNLLENVKLIEECQKQGLMIYICKDPISDESKKQHRCFHRRMFFYSTFVIPSTVSEEKVACVLEKILGRKR